MQLSFGERLKHAWNVFKNRDPTEYYKNLGYYGGSSYRPDYNRQYRSLAGDKSIITAIKTKIAVDAAQVDLQHVRLDENNRFVEIIDSGLNRCLSLSANIDQTGRAFRLDIFMSLLDDGVIALVPVDTTFDPEITGTYQINNIRVGKIVDWYPKHVRVSLYNENTGRREEIVIPKTVAAIVENPFYAVMNEPNSVFQRLTHKLALLDAVDEQASSGKLDLIIQLPYTVKNNLRQDQADKRRADIAEQLEGSKFGIAYIDATEKIIQLNRPLENNLLTQVQYLTDQAFDQLGTTKEILDGTADERAMLNYNNRIIEPLVAAVADSMKRTFLTQTAITQKQSIEYFRDPFALVPVDHIADIADKFTRNEIMTSNELRQIIGLKPSDDPNADVLRNKNLYDTTGQAPELAAASEVSDEPLTEEDADQALDDLDAIDAQLDELEDALEQADSGLEIYHNYDAEYRRQYYLEYEKKGRTKGRETSTKGLNEEGRAYAKYLREILGEERKAKVSESKAGMDAKIGESKSRTDSGIEKSKVRRDTSVKNYNSARDSLIETERNRTDADIEASQKQRDANVTRTNEQRDRGIESARTHTKSEIESHKNTMQTKIDTLKSYLSGLDKTQKAAIKERVQAEIQRLREDNSKKREELQEAFKTESGDIRSKAKSETDAYREEHRSAIKESRAKLKERSTAIRAEAKSNTDKVKEEHKTASAKLRQDHKDTTAILREAHKQFTAQAKKDYEDEYAANLEYIKSLPEYQAVAKSKSGKNKTKSTTVVYKGKKNI